MKTLDESVKYLQKHLGTKGLLKENDQRLTLPVNKQLHENLVKLVEIPYARRDYAQLHEKLSDGVYKKNDTIFLI